METETNTNVRPFPVPPTFGATQLVRDQYRVAMREAWIDRADAYLSMAQTAASAGDYLHAEVHLADARRAIAESRAYRKGAL